MAGGGVGGVDGGVADAVQLGGDGATALTLVEDRREGGEVGTGAVLDGGEEDGRGDGGATDGAVGGDVQEVAGARLRDGDEALGLAPLDGGGGVAVVEVVDAVEVVDPAVGVRHHDELLLAKPCSLARGGGAHRVRVGHLEGIRDEGVVVSLDDAVDAVVLVHVERREAVAHGVEGAGDAGAGVDGGGGKGVVHGVW